MKEIIKLSLALGLVCTVAATALAYAYSGTAQAIEETRIKQQSASLGKVLPGFDNSPLQDKVVAGDTTFYRARNGNGPATAVAGEAEAKGFGGPVKILVGINPDGGVRKVLVTGHSETPGLGTQVTDRQAQMTIFELMKGGKKNVDATSVPPNDFLDQFEDFSFDGDIEFSIGGTVTPISGATISSKAVTQAVKKVAADFAGNKETILK